MIRRVSLVRKRPELTREEFLARWTGEHVDIAKRLPGLRGYVIHILDGVAPPVDGIAVTMFDSHEDAERAFADPELADGLRRTRADFAASVEVYFAKEYVIVEGGEMSSTDRGRKRSLEVTGGPAQAAARSMLRAMGWTTDDLKLPQAGVAASWNAVTPCNMHVVEIDAESNRLHVELPDDEIASRLAAVEHPPPRYPTGVLAKYARLVGSAATGARVGA